ncbi:MAG: PP2C family protein-serine/threonine phosphatase [Lachnospiraceae bacterium]|nr:PP2C family protein-serine/threonine phosphatase [Lachnospiraceae bacterium]
MFGNYFKRESDPEKTRRKEEIHMMTYSSSIGISFINPVVNGITKVFMLVFSIINADLYGAVLWRYRCFYISFLIVSILYMVINLLVKKDIENRCWMLRIANPLYAIFSFAYALTLSYSDSTINGSFSQVLFTTISLAVVLSIFMLPLEYLLIAGAADASLIYILVVRGEVGISSINTFMFIIFQLVLGISLIQVKIKLSAKTKAAEERINLELDQAAKIQTSFLPRSFPPFPDREEFELFASMVPAKNVGGDFYDYFFVDKDHLALVMADVSGKGIPAAMFMVMAKTRLRYSVMRHKTDVARAMEEVNTELSKDNDEMMFVTIWLGVVDVATGHVDYVNAGHEYPAICSEQEGFKVCKGIHGPFAAAVGGVKYSAGSFELAPGDILFQYTDGITEATDANESMFGEERMLEALNKDTASSVEEIDATVRASVAGFVKDAPQFDDMTTLVFRYKGI